MGKRLALLTLLLVSFLLAACGSSDSEGTSNSQNNNEAATNGEEAVTVDISATNFQFDQEEYTVQSGEPVTINFTTEEGVHGINIDEFEVSIEGEGTATFTPEESGEYIIYCNIPCGAGHSDMQSTLIVQ